MSHTTFRSADGLNDTAVSAAAPLPVQLLTPGSTSSDWLSAGADSQNLTALPAVAAVAAAFNGTNYDRLRTAAGSIGAPGKALSVEEAGRAFSNLTAPASVSVKSGAGVLHAITINTKGATGNTLTLYDNTAASGTKIATIDLTATAGAITFNAAFGTGLFVALTGSTADVTVLYR